MVFLAAAVEIDVAAAVVGGGDASECAIVSLSLRRDAVVVLF